MLTIGAREFEATSTRVDLAGCGLGVGNPAAMRELAAALPRMPRLDSLDLSRNALCEADGAELSGFAGLLSVLVVCDSLTALNLAECGLGTDAAGLLAASRSRLRSLAVPGNPRIRDQGMVPLLGSLCRRQVVSLDLSDCGLGPPSVVALAELLVTECATIERVVLDNNPMFGTLGSKHAPGTADKFASAAGTADFFSGVQQSGLTALSICACGMGPAACSTLAACMPASLSELAVAHNPIGKPSSPAALRPGVEQAVVLVGAEVLAALRGRFGKVLGDPDEDEEVKLRWLDTGAESAYIPASALGPVVSCRSELHEDYGHLSELARAAVRATVLRLDLKACDLNPVAAGAFLQAVVDATTTTTSPSPASPAACLQRISLAANPIFGDNGSAGDSNLRDCELFFSALKAAITVRSMCFDETGMGKDAAGRLVASLPTTIRSISALNNPLGTVGVQSLKHYLLGVNLELRTLCGLEDGQTRVDWRCSAKGPSDMALLAADLDAAAMDRPAAARTLRDVALDGCVSVTGTSFIAGAAAAGSPEGDVAELDADMSGWEPFCRALPASAVVRVSLRSCYVGQAAVALLAEAAGVPAELLRQQAVARNLVVVMQK